MVAAESQRGGRCAFCKGCGNAGLPAVSEEFDSTMRLQRLREYRGLLLEELQGTEATIAELEATGG